MVFFVQIANSPLSEAAIVGFEYGFSMENPRRLVVWEAQFGDFCNAAQVQIDTLLASGETEWRGKVEGRGRVGGRGEEERICVWSF